MKNTILSLILVMAIFSASLATDFHNPIVLIQTNYGDIELELFINEAPITVANFLDYVNSGFYDGLIFHRVIPEFMIQGGGFDQDYNEMETNDPIVNESSNGLSNIRGTIAMARTSNPNSATSQFFINQVDNTFLDEGDGYCVFGQVISGINTVDAISVVDTNDGVSFPVGIMNDVPVENVIIYNAEHVTFVAPDGNNLTATGASDEPFGTIQAAVNNTDSGGTVVLEPGKYTGTGNRDIIFGGKKMIITSRDSNEINLTDPIAATIIDPNAGAGNEHQAFILSDGENVTIKNVTITGGYSRFGAAVYVDHAAAKIENCVITGNVGTFDGGGICLISSDAHIENCTIVGNSTTYNRYGIVYAVNSTATVSNCILYNEGYNAKEIYTYKSTANVSYCNINGGYAGVGNINIAPLFADANNGNFHLASQGLQWDITNNGWSFGDKTSYCIDAGDPNLSFSNETNIAVEDPNNDRTSRNLRINMGAYANKATASVAPFADFNGDNLVNFTDYAKMINRFMQAELTVLDINRDGIIDYDDLSMLAEDWVKGQGNLPQ